MASSHYRKTCPGSNFISCSLVFFALRPTAIINTIIIIIIIIVFIIIITITSIITIFIITITSIIIIFININIIFLPPK